MKPKTPTRTPNRSPDAFPQRKSTGKKKPEADIFVTYIGQAHAGKRIEGISYIEPEDEITQLVPGESHIFMLTKEAKILGIGHNDFGQLAQKRCRSARMPVNLLLKEKIGVSSVYAGSNFAFAVTGKYEVYSWGSNVKGQLGHGHFEDLDAPAKVGSLTPTQKLTNTQTLPFSECALNLNEIVIEVACGALHTLALTSQNRVFAAGFGGNFALGHGKAATSANFEEVSYFAGMGQKIDKVAAGVSHSACLTNGSAYVWGTLGLAKSLVYKKPNLIAIKEDVKDIALGDMNTILLTSQGEVLTLGENVDMQLGYKGASSSVPAKVKLPFKIEYITCGTNHVIAISKSKIIGWGSNRFGQIQPNSHETCIESPEELDWILEAIPLSIVCAYSQTYVISRSRLNAPKRMIHNQQQLSELKKEIESFKLKHLRLIKENDKLNDEVKALYSTLSHLDKTEDKIVVNPNDEIVRRYKAELKKARTVMPNYEVDYRELRFGDKLSEGAFGIVYKGMYRDLKVAIKTLKPKFLKEETIKDFLSELKR